MDLSPPACPQGSGPQDLELVRSVRNGDRNALERLAERLTCLPRMLAELNRRRGSRLGGQDLEDLAQDLVLLIWRKLQLFEGYGTLESWVYQFARFEFMNRLRTEDRRRRRVREVAVLPEPQPAHAGGREERPAVETLLADLPETERTVLALKHDEGLTFPEMSKLLGVSPNTLKARYYKALSRIRQRFPRGEAEA